MHISKTLLAACAGLLCATPGLVCAGADNDAQARARAALEEKMNQLESQPAPAPKPTAKPAQQPAPVAAPKPKPAPATVPAAVPAKSAYADTNVLVISAPETVSPDVYDKLSQAVDKKWQEIESSKPGAGSPVYQPLPASAGGSAAPAVSKTQPQFQPVTVEGTARPKTEKEQKALDQALEIPTVTPTVAQPPSGFAPLVGPPPTISASQQEQLNRLLQLYKADRITPEQYHERRAKILGEH